MNEFSLKLLSDVVMGTVSVPLTIALASVYPFHRLDIMHRPNK